MCDFYLNKNVDLDEAVREFVAVFGVLLGKEKNNLETTTSSFPITDVQLAPKEQGA